MTSFRGTPLYTGAAILAAGLAVVLGGCGEESPDSGVSGSQPPAEPSPPAQPKVSTHRPPTSARQWTCDDFKEAGANQSQEVYEELAGYLYSSDYDGRFANQSERDQALAKTGDLVERLCRAVPPGHNIAAELLNRERGSEAHTLTQEPERPPEAAPPPPAEPECDVARYRTDQCAGLEDKSTDPGVQPDGAAPPADTYP
jgi:hypothetical protein